MAYLDTSAGAAREGLGDSGEISTAEIAAGALSADATGRAIMATDYFNAATLLLKVADNAFAADAATRALFVNGIWEAAQLASDAVTTAKILDANVTQAKLATASLDGTIAKVVAAANVIGGLEVIHRFDLAAGALADTDIVLTHKTRVIDAWLVLRGAGVSSTTLTVKNGATAITNAMAASGSDQALVRATTLDDASWEIAAAGTLRVTSATGATQPDATVFVRGIRVT